MMLRRDFCRFAACAGAAAIPAPGWAVERLSLGDTEILMISDGNLLLPESFIFGTNDPEEFQDILAPYGGIEATRTTPCNVTLMRRNESVVLFDAGAGPAFMDSAGKLPDALDAAGVPPEEVTHVIFTHAHPDHLWGVVDDFDEPFFVNAKHLMGAQEMAFWTDPSAVDELPPDRMSFAAGASRRIDLLGERLESFEDGDVLVPGVVAILTPGHTPGHMSFTINLGDETLTAVGDAIGNGHLAFARPGALSPADQDPGQGAETRVALMNRLAEQGGPVSGFHLPGGGLGRIARDGEGFRWDSETPL